MDISESEWNSLLQFVAEPGIWEGSNDQLTALKGAWPAIITPLATPQIPSPLVCVVSPFSLAGARFLCVDLLAQRTLQTRILVHQILLETLSFLCRRLFSAAPTMTPLLQILSSRRRILYGSTYTRRNSWSRRRTTSTRCSHLCLRMLITNSGP